LNTLISGEDAKGPWKPFNWKQGIFSTRIPKKFDKYSRVWVGLRTVILWALWTERNDAAFNNIYWHPNKLLQRVWLGIVDYGRVEWDQVVRRRRSDGIDETLATRFVQCWCCNKVFAEMIDGVPRWVFAGPRNGFVFEVH